MSWNFLVQNVDYDDFERALDEVNAQPPSETDAQREAVEVAKAALLEIV